MTPGHLRVGKGRGRFVVGAAAEAGGRRSKVADGDGVSGLFGSRSEGVRQRVVQRQESCAWYAEAAVSIRSPMERIERRSSIGGLMRRSCAQPW